MSKLPKLLDIVDQETALKLMEIWGGGVLQIPRKERLPRHRLVSAIGEKAAIDLSTDYAGMRFYVPKITTTDRRIRDALIREKRANGATIQELATEFGLCIRMIHYLCQD